MKTFKELVEKKDPREYDYEGDMAISQLKTTIRHCQMLLDMLKPDTNLPEWVQSKITLATDYMQTAADYMMNEEVESDTELSEVMSSKRPSARRITVSKITKKGTKQFTRSAPLNILPVTNIASRNMPVSSAAGAKRNLFATQKTSRRLYNSYDPTDVSETAGAGEEGTNQLRKKYSKDTPGQNEELNIAPFSAEKSWVDESDEPMDTGKSPRTYQDIRLALSGRLNKENKNDKQ